MQKEFGTAVTVQSDDEIDVMSILDVILNSKRFIAASVAVCTLLGATYLMVARPVYRADITVQIEDSTGLASTAMSSLVGGLSNLFDIKSTDDGEMEILRSRLVTEKAVDTVRLNIEAMPKRLPLLGAMVARFNHHLSTPGLLGFGGYTWGDEDIDIAAFDVPEEFEDDKFVVTALGGNQYRLSGDDLEASQTGELNRPLSFRTSAGTVRLVIARLIAKPGAAFVLVRHPRQQVVKDLREKLKIAEAGKDQSGVIGVTYDDIDPARAAALLNSIAENYVRQNRERKTETANQSLSFLEGQLPEVQRHLEEAESKLAAYQSRHRIVDLSDQAKAILGQSTGAQSSLMELQQKRKELLATLSERHPAIVALDQQIISARESLADYETTMRRLPDDQQGIVRLMRDVRVKTEIYTGLLNSVQQVRLAKAGGVGNVRVIDHAVMAQDPVRPKPLLVLALSLIGGLFVGLAGCLGRAALAGWVTDPSDIERHAMVEVVAAVPVSDGQRQLLRLQRTGIGAQHILALKARRDPAVEALRLLRTRVQLAMADHGKGAIVLVTGPTEGLGKSFTAANLAVLLSSSGKRVLLVDADLHRGHLCIDFGVRNGDSPGLADVLRSTSALGDAIFRSVAPGVDLLGPGRVLEEPDELFGKPDAHDLIRAFSGEYDVVLIDSPPVLPVSDTSFLAGVADITLLVVRSGRTTGGEIVETIKRLDRAGSASPHVVFNGLRPGLRSKQYGYYGYGRGYRNSASKSDATVGSVETSNA